MTGDLNQQRLKTFYKFCIRILCVMMYNVFKDKQLSSCKISVSQL